MNNLNNQIYATVEVRNKRMMFTVLKYVNNNLLVIFKGIENNDASWTDESGRIKDVNKAAKMLSKMITNFETQNNGLRIVNVILVVPSNEIKISEQYTELSFSKEQNGENITEKHITYLIEQIKSKGCLENYQVISTETLAARVDNQPTSIEGLTKLKANKVGLTLRLVQLPKETINGYKTMIAKTGRSVDESNNFLPSITATFNAIAKQENDSKKTLVINWKHNSVEVGLFQNGKLNIFKKYSGGIDNISQAIAKKMKINQNIAEDYLFRNLDFTSTNNEQSVVYQSWNSNKKMLDRMNGKEFKEFIIGLINSTYNKIKKTFKDEAEQTEFTTYNFGVIQNIPGVESIIRGGKMIANDYVYDKAIFGANKDNLLTASIGATEFAKIQNSKKDEDKIVTAIFNRTNQVDNDEERTVGMFTNRKAKPTFNQGLYLKNEGIVIDSKKVNKK